MRFISIYEGDKLSQDKSQIRTVSSYHIPNISKYLPMNQIYKKWASVDREQRQMWTKSHKKAGLCLALKYHLKFFKLAKYGFHFYYKNDIVHLEDAGFLYCNYDLGLIWKYSTISKIQLCFSRLISPHIEKLHFWPIWWNMPLLLEKQ